MVNALARIIATGLGSGFGRPYPGTWGTIPAWIIGFFVIRGDQTVLLVAVAACTLVSVWAAGRAEKVYGHDARRIVIDEWAGMLVAFLFLPHTWLAYGLAFFAFRGFDVFKFFPARQSEKLPGGWGITADDIIAGAQACLAVNLILYALARTGYLD